MGRTLMSESRKLMSQMINKFRIKLFLLLCIGLPLSNFAQELFELKDSIIVLSKTLNFENVHWYGEIINLQDTIPADLQWKLETPFGAPLAWECNFDDQTQNSENVMDGDSAEFVLLADLEFLQKLIIGVQHNGSIGNAQYIFKISSLAEPEKIKNQVFRVQFEEGTTSNENLATEDIPLRYDGGKLYIHDEIDELSIVNSAGQSVLRVDDAKNGEIFDLNPSTGGVYFISWYYHGKKQVRKFYF